MMPKFTLQTVLDYRHTRVESIEIELGKLLAAEREGRVLLETLQQQTEELYRDLQNKQIGDIDLFQISVLRANIKAIQENTKKVIEALDAITQAIEAKRNDLVLARQGEEVLEVLKNKEIERYQAELNQFELRQQDEIYTAQAFRKRNQG